MNKLNLCGTYKPLMLVLLGFLLVSSCEPKENTVSNKIEFKQYSYPRSLSGNAVRTRTHKTISLKIYSDEGDFNPVINIGVPTYTNSDSYKNLPDTMVFSYPDVSFVLLDRDYYEAYEGTLIVLEDDDKIITGTFEFSARKMQGPLDTIHIEDGLFELEYLPSRVR